MFQVKIYTGGDGRRPFYILSIRSPLILYTGHREFAGVDEAAEDVWPGRREAELFCLERNLQIIKGIVAAAGGNSVTEPLLRSSFEIRQAGGGRDRTGRIWTGRDRTGRDRTGRIWTGRDRTGRGWTGRGWTGRDRTGRSWTGRGRGGAGAK